MKNILAIFLVSLLLFACAPASDMQVCIVHNKQIFYDKYYPGKNYRWGNQTIENEILRHCESVIGANKE